MSIFRTSDPWVSINKAGMISLIEPSSYSTMRIHLQPSALPDFSAEINEFTYFALLSYLRTYC
ncbi:MAG: hypothetical protein ACFFCM_14230 [Promethearchaeota archaeon]